MKIKPGEVWLADLGIAGKIRPVVIVSREDSNAPRALVIYVPFTTKSRASAYEVGLGKLPFLNEASIANVQGIASIPETRLERKLGNLPTDLLAKIKDAVRFALDL